MVGAASSVVVPMRAFADESLPVGSPEVITVDEAGRDQALQSLLDKVEAFHRQFIPDDSDAGASVASQIREEITSGRIPLHLSSGADVDLSRISVWASDSGGRFVFTPYAGTAVAPSGLTVAFDSSGRIAGVSESLYQTITDTSGTVTTWTDGALSKHVLVDASGTVKPAETEIPSAQPFWSASKFKKCLLESSIPAWVIAAVMAACAAICVATFGAGCVACAVGIAASYQSAFNACNGYASE